MLAARKSPFATIPSTRLARRVIMIIDILRVKSLELD